VSAARLRLAVLAVAVLAAAAARAESLYVIEQLVVSVNSAPDGSGERIGTLKSGERVEALERSGDAVHVRLGNGRDGWVRASYLSAGQPLHEQLAQRDAQLKQLQDEVSTLRDQLRGNTTAAAAAAAPAAATPVTSAAPPAEDPAAPAGMFPAADPQPRRLWPWTLGAALLGLGAGFALGALLLDRHIRRKYGGLRIY
jgi:hypothetical protein